MSSTEQQQHAYLQGFTSQYTEVSDQPLEVSGSIPPWLNGVLLRNGPGVYAQGKGVRNHLATLNDDVNQLERLLGVESPPGCAARSR